MELLIKQKRSQEEKNPKAEMGSDQRAASSHITVNETNPSVSPQDLLSHKSLDFPLPDFCLSDGCTQHFSYDRVHKSRTHDCVMELGPNYPVSPDNRDQAWTPGTCHHSRLVNSASFPGFGTIYRLLNENRNTHASNQEIIDYRSLAPQVPFMPSIAKSIPKKKIFMRKPKKAIKNLFVHKKQNNERITSPRTPSHEYKPTKKQTKKSLKYRESKSSCKMKDSLSDSSSDGCANVYEDAVSLKSFGSQAGCGEIFADEEYLVSLEGVPKLKTSIDSRETPKRSPVVFQSGMEPLASPSHPEVLDLFGMWETINRAICFSQSSGQEMNKTSTPISTSPSSNKTTQSMKYVTSRNMTGQDNNLNHTVTPKSENHESTSDEGYCDGISAEDHTGLSPTPDFSRKVPRDTYSGDSLYELFYDPSEAEMTPIFNDEVDLQSDIIGFPSPDRPLSMYSFHVGSEENLTPPLSVDLISQDFLQSNWVGKDCLLKLCDTEISLAMGIVNWMKQKTIKGNQADLGNPGISTDDSKGVSQQEVHIGNEELRTAHSKDNKTFLKLSRPCQVDAGHLPVDTVKRQTECQPTTPTSHVCFRLFSINSPSTPYRDLESPGTSSLFVLAVNKESLCEPCRGSLKHGAKHLHLCHSCTAIIEQIKTSELWPRANQLAGSPQDMLPSPSSSCGIASDISILSLVEQCANQMSSLKCCQHENISNRETRANQGCDNYSRKDRTMKFVKSSPQENGKVADGTNLKDTFPHGACSPSLLEAMTLGHVTTNVSDDFVLESYKNPCYLQTNPSDKAPASRPTSLTLPSATASHFSKQAHCSSITVKEKPRKRSGREWKPALTRECLPDITTTSEEKKMERRCKMKN